MEYTVVGEDHVDLAGVLDVLDARGIGTLIVDSGGTLNGHLLAAGLVDEVSVLVHPALVGARSFGARTPRKGRQTSTAVRSRRSTVDSSRSATRSRRSSGPTDSASKPVVQ